MIKPQPSITHLRFSSPRLPVPFNGYRILHVSDLHNRLFGENQSLLVQQTKEISPDAIVITGDLIDRRRTNIAAAIDYVSQAAKIAPVYFVAGNHEKLLGQYDVLSHMLRGSGVEVLDNRVITISKGNEAIAMIGVQDPLFSSDDEFDQKIGALSLKAGTCFKILLAHKPRMHVYRKHTVDIAFCGHAHGGQFRLPLVGGLYSPEQGVFPKYTSGIYCENDTSMVVSRGLGNSIFPFRLFNPPELVVVQLHRS